jgi:hypothetical protein
LCEDPSLPVHEKKPPSAFAERRQPGPAGKKNEARTSEYHKQIGAATTGGIPCPPQLAGIRDHRRESSDFYLQQRGHSATLRSETSRSMAGTFDDGIPALAPSRFGQIIASTGIPALEAPGETG